MAAAQGGEADALDALLCRHYDRLRALCRRVCGTDADADDATQEALIAVIRGLPAFDGRAAFATWVHRVATNACLDELRRRARRPLPWGETDPAVTAPSPVTTSPVSCVTTSSGQADSAEATLVRLDLDAALAQVAPEMRAAVVLRDLCGYDYAAIAEILDVPVGTVRSRISRGRSRLADLLDLGNRPPRGQRPTSDHGHAPTPTTGGPCA